MDNRKKPDAVGQMNLFANSRRNAAEWKVDCGVKKSRTGTVTPGRLAGYFDRRLESAESASCLLVLDDFLLLNVFDALDATFADVRTEFLGKRKHTFVKGCFPSFEPPKKVYHLISPQSTN